MEIYFDKIGNKFCGVNNYANKLQKELESNSYENNANVLNIHYPIQSLKFSLLIVIKTFVYKIFKKNSKIILTLHEYKTSSKLRKMSANVLLFLCDNIVVSNEEERKALSNIKKDISIIPIFANIKCKPIQPELNCNKKRILFFGNFYPARKVDYIIDEFIRFNNKEYELFICGSPNERHREYYNQILNKVNENENIFIKVKVSEEEICQIASESLAAISIYDDGLSSKRTSALIFLAMGLPLISNKGINTEESFLKNNCFYEYDSFEKCAHFFRTSENYKSMSKNGLELYENNFSEKLIVEKYREVFDNVTK